jgi:2OG-Fe(II) oxygenase superfamily
LVLTVSRPHLLAPTASDLVKYNEKDTILAGFHTDLNFLTIHGRSRYPGLHIWARNTGKRLLVQFPPTGRYLLVQAGKQLEHLTGGLIKAGYHEVVVNESTLAVISPCYRALVLMCSMNVKDHPKTQIRISGSASHQDILYILLAPLV